jgi:hypothetical protein
MDELDTVLQDAINSLSSIKYDYLYGPDHKAKVYQTVGDIAAVVSTLKEACMAALGDDTNA